MQPEPFFGLGRTFVLAILVLVVVAVFGFFGKTLPPEFMELALGVLGIYTVKSGAHAWANRPTGAGSTTSNGGGSQ